MHSRMLRLANRKDHLRQIEQRRRKVVEQPEEHRIPPAVADARVRQPHHHIARIHVRIVIHQIAEVGQRHRIRFARGAVDHLWRLQGARPDKPAHRDRRVDDIVARDDVNGRAGIAGHGAEQTLDVAGEEAEVAAARVAHPARDGVLVGSVHCWLYRHKMVYYCGRIYFIRSVPSTK